MKKVIFLILLCLFSACSSTEKPALWLVQHENASLYLVGTVHMLQDHSLNSDSMLMDALHSSGTLILEADAESSDSMQYFLTYAVDKDTPLSEKLPQDLQDLYMDTLSEIGMDYSQLEMFKPWAAAFFITIMAYQKQGYDYEAGVDEFLRQEALAAKKNIEYLESAEEAMSFFTNISMEQELEFFSKTLKEIPNAMKKIESLVAAWGRADTAALETLMEEEFKDFPELYSFLIKERNERWAEKLGMLLEQGSGTMFAAVGALHLAGPDGLEKILERKGYTVSRLR
jgi:uncharacterized protein